MDKLFRVQIPEETIRYFAAACQLVGRDMKDIAAEILDEYSDRIFEEKAKRRRTE